MRNTMARRTLLAGIPAAALVAGTGRANAEEAVATAYAAFRVVRVVPGEPTRPEITFPEGYSAVPGEKYDVASRAEYYTVVQGPRSDAGIEVSVRWERTPIEAVIWHESRLRLKRDPQDPWRVTFTLPVTYSSAGSTQATIQVWSFMDTAPGINLRIEHNDPDRVAGPWTTVPFPAGQVKSVIHQLIASDLILKDSGLAATAAVKGHFYALMGFETNNTLHTDNPPHWHLAYYAGADFGARAYLPHFWFNSEGRNYYNGMDVSGMGRQKYYVGDPAPMFDFAEGENVDSESAAGPLGNLVATTTIREDGGLSILPPAGPEYAIAAGRNGDLVEEVTVLRDGKAWLRVRGIDQVRAGVMVFTVVDLQNPSGTWSKLWRYDRLTGILK